MRSGRLDEVLDACPGASGGRLPCRALYSTANEEHLISVLSSLGSGRSSQMLNRPCVLGFSWESGSNEE